MRQRHATQERAPYAATPRHEHSFDPENEEALEAQGRRSASGWSYEEAVGGKSGSKGGAENAASKSSKQHFIQAQMEPLHAQRTVPLATRSAPPRAGSAAVSPSDGDQGQASPPGGKGASGASICASLGAEGGKFVIRSVWDDAQVLMRIGDEVVKVDGISLHGMAIDEVLQVSFPRFLSVCLSVCPSLSLSLSLSACLPVCPSLSLSLSRSLSSPPHPPFPPLSLFLPPCLSLSLPLLLSLSPAHSLAGAARPSRLPCRPRSSHHDGRA